MAITIPQDRPLIAINFCGGTGYNIGKAFAELAASNDILRETVKCYFVDTSTANNSSVNTEDNTIVIGSGKGSGKTRGANAAEIRAAVPQILHTFTPGVFNINVAGASGGSGGTIANEISRAHMSRAANVVNVLIGSRSSRSEIENTDKTFRSFANAAQKFNRPALVHFRENSVKAPRQAVDKNVLNNLLLMCILFSGKDDKMDESDLTNLLNYPAVTSFSANVVGFDLFLGNVALERHETLYSVGTLALEDTDTDVEPTPEYQVAGYLKGGYAELLKDAQCLHWAVLGNSFGPMMKELAEKVAAFQSAAAAHRQDTFVTAGEDDDDLVV